jgi:predicted PhzF superfamily epimerase YddE/YHI9
MGLPDPLAVGGELAKVLGVEPASSGPAVLFIGQNKHDTTVVVTPAAFAAMTPNPAALAAVVTRIISITTPGGLLESVSSAPVAVSGHKGYDRNNYHFVSRCFAPRGGTPEDTVCGAAHCGMAPYWADVVGERSGQQAEWMKAFQASPRGGDLMLKAVDGGFVLLRGRSATIKQGTMAEKCDFN